MDQNTPPVTSAHARMVAMLMDPHAVFDRSQAAYLMAAAARWTRDETAAAAYAAGERDGHAASTALVQAAVVAAGPVRVWTVAELARSSRRAAARHEHDVAAVHPWRGDYPGGPVLEYGWSVEGPEVARD